MNIESLKDDLITASKSLLKLARNTTYSSINDHCLYILSEGNYDTDNFHISRKIRKTKNDKKTPQLLETLTPILQNIYDDLFSIELYIYHAKKNQTIIEILYYLKDKNSSEEIFENFRYPHLHSKINIPFWLSMKDKKFDINWEHKPYLIQWKILKYRFTKFLNR